MFFSYSILVSKNSNFAIIWKYMHDRHGISKVSKRELLSIDITKACEDLQNYIPTGALLKSELRNKMSLYLLGQLSYGITLVLQAHANYLITDLESAIKSFARFPDEHKHDKTPRKSTGGRKRRVTELDGAIEAVIGMGLEPEEEEGEGTKRRRTSTARNGTKLDLADPSAYVDQQLPGRGLPEQSLLMDEENRLDDMFMNQTVQPALPPPEWAPQPNDLLSLTEPTTEHHGSQKVSMISLLAGDDTLVDEMRQPVTVTSNLSAFNHPVEEIGLELPMETTRDPVYKKRSTDEPPIEIVADSPADRLQLDSLPDIINSPKPVHPKKRKRLLVDDQIELKNEQILDRINNFKELLRTRDDLHKEIAQPNLPTLSQLLDPRPYHIKALNPELFPLFDSVRAVHKERPLTFEEVQAMTLEDFRLRRLPIDLQSWHSNDTPMSLQQRIEESFGYGAPHDKGREKEKVSVSEALIQTTTDAEQAAKTGENRQSSVLEGEAMRRDTGDSHRRLTDYSFGRVEPDQITTDLDRTEPPLVEEITVDREIMHETAQTKEITEGMWDEQMVDDNTRELYSRVVRGGVASFEELLKSYSFGESKIFPITRAVVARKFFAVLNLLKHRKIKVRQHKPYGEILIRARKTSEENVGEDHSFIDQLK